MNILGCKINSIRSYESAYKYIMSKKNDDTTSYVTVNNVHTIIEAVRSNKYREILNHSLLSLPDGKPLSVYAKLKGSNNVSRIFGPTFMEKTLEWGQNEGLKHYFFGGSEATLKEMLNKIEQKFPEAVIAGYYSPPYKEKFSEAENKKFIEQMNNSNADIFCFPTYYPIENQPLVLLEAMLHSLPIISTNWRAIPDIITDGEEGFLVPINSPIDIAKKIELLSNDKDLREQMGKKGREKFLKEYTIEKHLARMEQAFKEVLAND